MPGLKFNFGNMLLEAAQDARYLLGRGYPRELVLKLAGDRYVLDADQRHFLRRGVFSPPEARARRARLFNLDQVKGAAVGVDGHNVLITLETALAGGRLLLADDGLVRDIAGQGRNHRPRKRTEQAARMLLKTLQEAGAGEIKIWLDAPLSKSGELAARLRELMSDLGILGDARAVPVPENELARHRGPVASSDSALIDQVAQPLDLAGAVIARMKPPPSLERLA